MLGDIVSLSGPEIKAFAAGDNVSSSAVVVFVFFFFFGITLVVFVLSAVETDSSSWSLFLMPRELELLVVTMLP
jgi:hypothetical protein